MNRCEIFPEFFNVPPTEQEYGVHVVDENGAPQKPMLRHATLDEATAMMMSWSANSDGDTADCPELGFTDAGTYPRRTRSISSTA